MEAVQGALRLWGEWEADADVVPLQDTGPACADYVQCPALRQRASYAGLHNTDPFVFDGRFLYSNCHQDTHNGRLKRLDRGSVLIFGSKDDSGFVLDTVFVVGKRCTEYLARNAVAELRNVAPRSFIHAVAEPIQASARAAQPGCIRNGARFVLYEGATTDEPVNGMFSFAPATCTLGAFPRPAIDVAGLNPKSWRAPKELPTRNANLTLDQIRSDYWESLVAQVAEAGLLLGTRFDLNP